MDNFIKFQENFCTYKAKMNKLMNDFQHPIDNLILQHKPEAQELIHFLRKTIKSVDTTIEELFKYKTIFYHCNGKSLCYINSTKGIIYIGFVQGYKMKKRKVLLAEGRKMIRVFKMDPNENVDINLLNEIMKESVELNKRLNKKKS